MVMIFAGLTYFAAELVCDKISIFNPHNARQAIPLIEVRTLLPTVLLINMITGIDPLGICARNMS